jgi:hypothetical protein
VAGGWNGTIFAFDRGQAAPRFTYQTDGPVMSVALSHDGRAFAAGTDYGGGCCPGGKIYYFECDRTIPSWIYDCARDEAEEGRANEGVKGVAISADGRWIAAVSRYHVYLFRRDMVNPVLKLQLSTEASLATVAISADGSQVVVGTGPEADFTRSSVFYLDHHGLIWTSTIDDLGWGPNNLPTPVAISADGSVIAAGGRDNRVHLWDNTSSTPRWTYKIAEQSPVSSIALSDDGTRLAATGNWTLYFFDHASIPTWSWDGSFNNPQPVLYPYMAEADARSWHEGWFNQPDTWFGCGNYLQALALSSDGSYIAAGAYVYNYAFSFYREFNFPLRMYALEDWAPPVVDVSPDGSWIMLGGTQEVLRIEVAPSEVIRVQFPLTYRIWDTALDEYIEPIGGGHFDVDYWILKPGRAATLTEEWSIWAYSGGVIIPPNPLVCKGDMEWRYGQDLADGNQVITGTRQISPPQCLGSAYSTIDFLYLDAKLYDEPSHTELSQDYPPEIVATVQLGTGVG